MKRIYTLLILFVGIAGTARCATPEEARYNLLSESYALRADGSMEYRRNMQLTLFTHTAMNKTYGETFIVYNPDGQQLKIHSSYTIQKDGTRIDTPDNAFVEVLPRQAANAPAYNHLKEMVVVHTGLELGATIYLDYSIISQPGYLPELDICQPIAQTSPVGDYRLTISVPEAKPLFCALENSAARPVEQVANGVKQHAWQLRNLPAASREPRAALSGKSIRLLASTYPSNAQALKLFARQFATNDEAAIRTQAARLKGKNDTETLQQLLTYIVDQVDLIPLSPAQTGFRLRPAEQVIRSAYGTEAEKVNLLSKLLTVAGIHNDILLSYPFADNLNRCAVSAADHYIVKANADGKHYLLSVRQKTPSNAGRYVGFEKTVALTGGEVAIEAPSYTLEGNYRMELSADRADIRPTLQAGDGWHSYTAPDAGNAPRTTAQPLKDYAGLRLLALPDAPQGVAHSAYVGYNSRRTQPLLLDRPIEERYTYTLTLPAGAKLATPTGTQQIDNAVGTLRCEIRQTGNTVQVERTLKLKKQLIAPAEYAAFRALVTEWATNNRLLVEM
jgi:hypothetical protein